MSDCYQSEESWTTGAAIIPLSIIAEDCLGGSTSCVPALWFALVWGGGCAFWSMVDTLKSECLGLLHSGNALIMLEFYSAT